MKRKVEVTLLGQRFTLRSEQDVAYVHSLANFVSRKLEEIRHQTRTVSSHDLALLAALNIADELFQCERRNAEARGELREFSQTLLENVDATLESLDGRETEDGGSELIAAERDEEVVSATSNAEPPRA